LVLKLGKFFNRKSVKKKTKKPEWAGEDSTEETIKLVKDGIIKKGTRVLDVGCGEGRNSNYFAENGAIVDAINISESELITAKERAKEKGVKVNYVEADAGSIPFPNSEYDVVLDGGCTHLCDKEKQISAAKEMARLIKVGGTLHYFGFNKEHPGYKKNPDNPMFRNLEDVRSQFGEYFEIDEKSVQESRWNSPKGGEHVGLRMVMKRNNVEFKIE
jgi:ubiquinone/menaquinone biosynthesis C-methylase UbiE